MKKEEIKENWGTEIKEEKSIFCDHHFEVAIPLYGFLNKGAIVNVICGKCGEVRTKKVE